MYTRDVDWSIPVILLQLIFLEGILSIDNAAVLGAMVSHLPDDPPIDWPHRLQTIGQAEPGEADAHVHPLSEKSFWSIVLAVELADLAFSLDNVVAAVAVSNKILIVMLGVAIGIIIMRFAAGWFSYVVEREPILEKAAYVLVLNIAIELLSAEFTGAALSDLARFGISVATIIAALIYARVKGLHVSDPILTWLAQGFANFNEVFD